MNISFFSNIGLKFASLVLAVTAYIYIAGEVKESSGTLPSAIVKDYIAKSVPVHVDLLGKPPRGFEVNQEGIVVEPDKILLIGPENLIGSISYLETQPIYVGRRSGMIQVRTGLKITRAIRGIEQKVVDVVIPIQRAKKENK